MTNRDNSKNIVEFLIEIRFEPHAKILDKRGEIALALTGDIFDNWTINNNEIKFSSSKNDAVEGFFSYKNVGILSRTPNDETFFIKSFNEFIRIAWNHFPTNELSRIGVRAKYLVPSGSFISIFNNYKKKFLALEDSDFKDLGGELIDIGFPLNFIDGENYFNIVTGPMEKKQFDQILSYPEEKYEFDSAFFLDVDYFRTEFSPHIKQKDIINFVKDGLEKSEKILEKVSDWVIKNEDG